MPFTSLFRNFSIIVWLFIYSSKAIACASDFSINFAEACLFQPTLEQKRSFSPFLFTYNQFYFYRNQGQDNSDRLRNADEWLKASGADQSGVKRADVLRVLYFHSSAEFLYAFERNIWDEFADNAFIAYLRKNRKTDFLQLLYLAKRSEAFASEITDPWGEDKNEESRVLSERQKLLEELNRSLVAAKLPFVKQRLAYLHIRLAYSMQEWNDILGLFRSHLDKTGSIVEHWGRHFAGFARWHNGDSLGATADLLLSFHHCDEKKLRIMQSISLPHVRELLKSSKDKDIRHIASAILLLNQPGPALQELQVFLRTYPQSPYQDLLLAREASKTESWIFAYTIFGERPYQSVTRWTEEPSQNWELKSVYEAFQKANLKKDLQYYRELRVLIRTYAKGSSHSAVYHQLMDAHMGIVLGEYAASKNVLNRIGHFPTKQHRMQWLTEMMFLQLQWREGLAETMTRNTMAGWMKELLDEYLPVKRAEDSLLDFEYGENSRAEPIVELAALGAKVFRLSGDLPTAWMFEKMPLKAHRKIYEWQFRADYDEFLDDYASESDIDRMLKLRNPANRDSLQRVVCGGYYPDTLFLIDLRGTKQIRKLKFREALATLSRIPAGWYDSLPRYKGFFSRKSVAADMFMPVSLSQRDTLKHASKLEHLKELVALTDELEKATGEKRAMLLYSYGNALINMSSAGRKWKMASYGSMRYFGEFRIDTNSVFEDYASWDLLFLIKAGQCFEEAKRISKDRNLQAGCCVMLMVLQDPVLTSEGDEEVTYLTVSAKGRPRLAELRKYFSGTTVYEQVKANCW